MLYLKEYDDRFEVVRQMESGETVLGTYPIATSRLHSDIQGMSYSIYTAIDNVDVLMCKLPVYNTVYINKKTY